MCECSVMKALERNAHDTEDKLFLLVGFGYEATKGNDKPREVQEAREAQVKAIAALIDAQGKHADCGPGPCKIEGMEGT